LSRIVERDLAIVHPVQDQKRPRPELVDCVNRTMLPEFLSPLVQGSWVVIKIDDSNISTMFEKAARIRSPIIEVGAGSHRGDTANLWVS